MPFRRPNPLTGTLVALGLLLAGPPALVAQDLPDTLQVEVVRLLEASPLLDPTLDVVREAVFVRDVRTMLRSVDDDAHELDDVVGATRLLEAQLADETVTANVRSLPPGLTVRYRRITAPEESAFQTTTDAALGLQPALYVFEADDPDTGVTRTLRTPCATDCSVVFDFSAPGAAEPPRP